VISAVTNLHVSRIADFCSKHGRIEMKERQRHMWRVLAVQPNRRIHAVFEREPIGK
jgi:hypothetical protein